jgi:RimJ/RimL family protein N-acetyltransferase
VNEVEAPTFPASPPARIALPEGLGLVRADPERTEAAVRAINESLEHLQPWMAWAAEPATEEHLRRFFTEAAAQWDERHDFGFSIIEEASGAVVGGCGLHGRIGDHGLEIGYWVHVDRIGKGVATDAARALTDAAFGIGGIERVRIQCDVRNVRSARVPTKLGYQLLRVEVPDTGPCEGRATQIWEVERSAWRGSMTDQQVTTS